MPVLRVSGTPLEVMQPGSTVSGSQVGAATLRFADDGRLDFAYRIGSAERTVKMDPFPFAGAPPRCLSDGAV